MVWNDIKQARLHELQEKRAKRPFLKLLSLIDKNEDKERNVLQIDLKAHKRILAQQQQQNGEWQSISTRFSSFQFNSAKLPVAIVPPIHLQNRFDVLPQEPIVYLFNVEADIQALSFSISFAQHC